LTHLNPCEIDGLHPPWVTGLATARAAQLAADARWVSQK
jgi:hypothetical protein